MTKKDIDTFNLRLRWRIAAGLIFVVAYASMIRELWPDPWLTMFAATSGVVFITALLIGNITQIHNDGINVSHFFRLQWSEVKSARYRSYLGLPYLYIQRKRGMNWWLPLYLSGTKDILDSLVDMAPTESPVAKVARDLLMAEAA